MATRRSTAVLRPAPDDVLASAFDDAVERIRILSSRLWAVRAVHRPVRGLTGRVRCAGCAERYPCPTLRACDTTTAQSDHELSSR